MNGKHSHHPPTPPSLFFLPFLPLFTLLVNKATPGEIDGVEWSGVGDGISLPPSPSSFRLPQLPMRCNGAALPTSLWGTRRKNGRKREKWGESGLAPSSGDGDGDGGGGSVAEWLPSLLPSSPFPSILRAHRWFWPPTDAEGEN